MNTFSVNGGKMKPTKDSEYKSATFVKHLQETLGPHCLSINDQNFDQSSIINFSLFKRIDAFDNLPHF